MYIVVGLGNPGKKYDVTRHNIGFEVIDNLSRLYHVKVNKVKAKALIGEARVGTEKVLLVKPQTYMNLSGESVRELMDYYKIPMENLIIIYDDIDIDPGKIRIRKKGSAGSHNGMRNIVYMLSSDQFPRIRLGVGKNDRMDLASYVLKKLTKEEIEVFIPSVKAATEAVDSMIREGIDKAMNKYNVK